MKILEVRQLVSNLHITGGCLKWQLLRGTGNPLGIGLLCTLGAYRLHTAGIIWSDTLGINRLDTGGIVNGGCFGIDMADS